MPESSVKHPPPGLPLSSSPQSKHQKTPSNPATPQPPAPNTPMSPAFTPTTPTPHHYQQSAPAQVVIPSLPASAAAVNGTGARTSLTQSLNSPPSSTSALPSTTSSKSRPSSLANTTTSSSRPASLTASNALSTGSNPSTPSSPGFFHKPNRDSTASNMSNLSSSRPAPPSPAISRRTSTMSGISGGVDAPGVLSRANSTAGGGAKRKSGRESLGTTSMLSTRDEVSEVTEVTVPTEPNTPAPLVQIVLRASIKIRDFAYEEDDRRFWGRGGAKDDVPKQNRLKTLNKALMGEEAYRVWKEDRRKKRMEEETTKGSDRNSVGWSSASEASEDDEGQEAFEDDDEDEEDDGGGWGGFKFGMGRLSWNMGGGASSSSSQPSSAPRSGYPSRKDLARNFGGMEDSSESDDTDESQDGMFYDAQEGEDQNDETYYDDDDDEDPPLYPGLYRALYAFEPEGSAELPLVEDQIVRVVGRGGGVGWAVVLKGSWTLGEDGIWKNEGPGDVGEDGKEKHGLVPESYLEPVRLDLDDEE